MSIRFLSVARKLGQELKSESSSEHSLCVTVHVNVLTDPHRGLELHAVHVCGWLCLPGRTLSLYEWVAECRPVERIQYITLMQYAPCLHLHLTGLNTNP